MTNSSKHEVELREIMTTDLFTVDPGTTLEEAATLLAAEHIGGVPVLSGGRLVGVLSATDILEFETSPPGRPSGLESSSDGQAVGPIEAWGVEDESPGAYFVDTWPGGGRTIADRIGTVDRSEWRVLAEYTVSDVMTRKVFSLPPHTDVQVAADRMLEADVHRVLVMEDEELLGIVSTRDVLGAVAERGLGDRRSRTRP